MRKNAWCSGVLAVLICCLTACEDAFKSAEEKLDDRVKAYHQARLNNDFELAYSFMSKGYRSLTPIKLFIKNIAPTVRFVDFEVISKKCEESFCIIDVKIRYRYTGAAAVAMGSDYVMTRGYQEKWIEAENQWWLVDL